MPGGDLGLHPVEELDEAEEDTSTSSTIHLVYTENYVAGQCQALGLHGLTRHIILLLFRGGLHSYNEAPGDAPALPQSSS